MKVGGVCCGGARGHTRTLGVNTVTHLGMSPRAQGASGYRFLTLGVEHRRNLSQRIIWLLSELLPRPGWLPQIRVRTCPGTPTYSVPTPPILCSFNATKKEVLQWGVEKPCLHCASGAFLWASYWTCVAPLGGHARRV